MKQNQKSWLLLTVLAIALLFLPFITDALLGRGWVRIVDFAMLYIMLALGLNIVVGYAGLLDLGYIAFFAVGAYCYALTGSPHLAHAFPGLFPQGIHLSFWLVMPLAALLAGGFGALLGAPTLRLRGDYLAIVTLGFGEITRIFMNNLNAPVNLTNGPQGISRIDPISLSGIPLNRTQEIFGISFPSVHLYFYLFLAFTVLVIFVSQRLRSLPPRWASIPVTLNYWRSQWGRCSVAHPVPYSLDFRASSARKVLV
jgi:branched-chain amino acid transport system permease protein